MKIHVKRLMSLSLFVFLIFSAYSGLLAEKVPPLEVVRAAQAGICDFAGAELAPGKSIAASDKGMPVDPALHHGFQVYTVTPPELMNVKSSGLTSIISPTGLWRFVVLAGSQPVSLLTVAQVDGAWKAVSIGGAQLAGEVNRVIEKWPAKSGYSHRFLRIYQARTDFIEISRNGQSIGFVPLAAARVTFGITGAFDPGAVLHASEVTKPLQNIVAQTMIRSRNRK